MRRLLLLLAVLALCLPGVGLAQPVAPTGSASAAPSEEPSASAAPTVAPAPAPPPPAPSATASSSASAVPPEPTPEPAPQATSAAPVPEPPAAADPPPAEVRVGETVAFVVRVRSGDQSPAQRAAAASKALKDALGSSTPDDVHVQRSGDAAIVYVGRTPVVQLTAADAASAGDASLEVHADSVVARIKVAMQAEQQRSALASRVFAICLVVFFAVVVLYLWRRIGDFAERANGWLEDNPHRIPEVRVRTLTLLNPAAFRSALALAISVGKWVGQLALVYLWLFTALSLFDATRPYTGRINAIILQPFLDLASRIAGSLPITVVVAIAVLVVAIVFRVVGLFFESVRDGTTDLEWLPPELARPTSVLVRAGLVLVTLIFAAPVLTGHPGGALATAGTLGLATLALASTPLLASCVVGVVVVYGRRVRIGDHVAVGDRAGRVVDVGLVDMTLTDAHGLETRIPHLVLVLHPLRALGQAPRVSVRIEVPPATAGPLLLDALLTSAATAGAHARAEIERIGVDKVTIDVSVESDDRNARHNLHLLALEVLGSAAGRGAGPAP